jgi:hypothetical protein
MWLRIRYGDELLGSWHRTFGFNYRLGFLDHLSDYQFYSMELISAGVLIFYCPS